MFVEVHCRAIDLVLHNGTIGEIYNISGSDEKRNIDVAKMIIKALNKSEDLITLVQDRPGHDRRYSIDNTKIMKQLDLKRAYNFETGIIDTINWYLNNEKWLNNMFLK